MPGLQFDGRINLGNLISVILLLGGLATAWHQLDTRLTVAEVRQTSMQGSIADLTIKTAKTENYILAHDPGFLPMVTKSRPIFAPAGHVVGATGEAFGQSVAADAPAEKAPPR